VLLMPMAFNRIRHLFGRSGASTAWTSPRSGGGPERSGGRGAAGPEAIGPGALSILGVYSGQIADVLYRTHR
jgi:hypothetical protein